MYTYFCLDVVSPITKCALDELKRIQRQVRVVVYKYFSKVLAKVVLGTAPTTISTL
jgi:hypothetical protein